MSSNSPAPVRQFPGRIAYSILAVILPVSVLPFILTTGLLVASLGNQFRLLPSSYLTILTVSFLLMIALMGAIIWLFVVRLTQPLYELTDALGLFLAGNWDQRSAVLQRDEIALLASYFNQLAEEMQAMHQSLNNREIEKNPPIYQALAQVSFEALSLYNRDSIIKRILEIVISQYGYLSAAVYLPHNFKGEYSGYITLHQIAHQPKALASPVIERFRGQKIPIEPSATNDWLISKAFLSKGVEICETIEDNKMYEAAIPIAVGNEICGVLDVFAPRDSASKKVSLFSLHSLSNLKTLSTVLAIALTADELGSVLESQYIHFKLGVDLPNYGY